MDKNVINECLDLSLAGKITFPEVVKKLISVGIERYIADLVGLRKMYFGTKDEVHDHTITLGQQQPVGEKFDAEEIKNTVKDIQQGLINYHTFLLRIMSAGCSHYEVFLKGQKAIYFGRDGSYHIELFPGAK